MNNNFDTNRFNNFVYYGIIIYLFSIIFEGPIRFILYYYGIAYSLYIRDIFIILVIAVYISQSLMTSKINRTFLIVMFIFTFHAIVALFYVNNYLMPLFAWKTYLLLFFGILYGHLLFNKLRLTLIIFSMLLICAIIGVVINYFIEFPWEGLEYRLGGLDIEAVRLWTDMSGIKRLSGFARTSYDAAMQILLLALFLLCYLKNNYSKILLWLFIAAPILLTTTKGIIVTYLLLTMFLLAHQIVPNYGKMYQKVLFVLLAVVIILPVLSTIVLTYHNVPLYLESFFMRMGISWPDAFRLVQHDGNILLGRGLGGMGTSQQYFEIEKFNPGDNIFLLFYGNCGLLGFGYLCYIAIRGQSLDFNTERFYLLFLFSFFSYGIVDACIDNAFFCLFLGSFLGYANNQKLRNGNFTILSVK
jgi:hypothetical protein